MKIDATTLYIVEIDKDYEGLENYFIYTNKADAEREREVLENEYGIGYVVSVIEKAIN